MLSQTIRIEVERGGALETREVEVYLDATGEPNAIRAAPVDDLDGLERQVAEDLFQLQQLDARAA